MENKKNDRTPPIKRGDWCVFWDEKECWQHSYDLEPFNKMDGKWFADINGYGWKFCQLLSKFDPNNPVSIRVEDYDWEDGE